MTGELVVETVLIAVPLYAAWRGRRHAQRMLQDPPSTITPAGMLALAFDTWDAEPDLEVDWPWPA